MTLPPVMMSRPDLEQKKNMDNMLPDTHRTTTDSFNDGLLTMMTDSSF